MTPRPKVLFIGGSGRNGSTLLASVLGQIQGFCSVGELRYLWDRGLIENRHCGCGERFRECPFWGDVLASAFGAGKTPDPHWLLQRREGGLRSRHLLVQAAASHKLKAPGYREYLEATRRLYSAIAEVSGCRVIVDSSKFPSYQYVLESFADLDVYTVHLVRDPRAVTYSYSFRRKPRSPFESDRLLDARHPMVTALSWHEWNVLLRKSQRRRPDRYLALRYEDFASSPHDTVRRIEAFVGEDAAPLPFVTEREVVLGVQHTVSGNPNRFKTGAIPIRADEEWRSSMTWRMWLMVSLMTWPERMRYGYKRGLVSGRVP